MVILAIDTSTRWAGVALLAPPDRGWEIVWHSPQNHSAELAPAVQVLLERAGVTLKDLSGIVVALGPGSFSALRVGLGFGKGLAVGLGCPIVGISTLEVEAASVGSWGVPLCPVLDLGRGVVAWGVISPNGVSEGERVSRVEEMAEAVPVGGVVCGEGAWVYREQMRPALQGRAVLLATPPPTRRPLALARLGQRRLTQGATDNLATLQPHYLRPPSIGPTRPPPSGGAP
ncbi:MAG: tRNA (adenosine(37)-N6)-threonylcarbamoyltransferase complex dimerization subunit type 1 TsaB [Dehalococcoidia bacterium]|nr:tRNA (adenosine(37)-N6)-threonylcarbamoyltransferase complex dimerization subunit type 1 TsaB [Dehalococcoidia bacterium]MDW8119756.1 tRNA (adenosine(37)-N6)-threonylcarbamoyltransferase complex dimerization subunit type 1 TsaB [Chloroflexota bacterium]